MRNVIGLFALSFVTILTHAAPAAHPAPAVRATPGGRLQSETTLFTQKSLGPKGYLKPDQVGGCCFLLGTVIRVENLDGKKLSELKTETIDTITLTGLKPTTAYNLILMNPRYKTPIKLEKVMSGNWINFKSP